MGPGKVATTALLWSLLGVFFINSALFALSTLDILPRISPLINALSLSVFAFVHGARRYGLKNILLLLALSWVVSVTIEVISVHTGFPFGLYSYRNAPPPWIMGVPVATGTVYFSMAYVSWMLAQLLLRRQIGPLRGHSAVTVAIVATFLMVSWDFCLDPVYSTIFSVWIWPSSGSYFGVPLSNYAGWFLAAYIIFQTFALYIARHDAPAAAADTLGSSPIFWYQLIAAYFVQGLPFALFPFSRADHREIYQSMALAFVMTMLFVCVLCVLAVRDGASQWDEESVDE
jgi:putative membrane protein